MGFLWLLNFVLIAFPIGATVGALLGLQTHRIATGQAPLFVDNGIKSKSYCQKTLGISPPSKADHYTCKRRPFCSCPTMQDRLGCCETRMMSRRDPSPFFHFFWTL